MQGIMRAWILFGVAVTCVALYLILQQLRPPQTLVLAAGPDQGAYARIAGQYQRILARDGIDLTILHTAGSAENAALLGADQVQAALLQGGIQVSAPHVETLGTLFYEPMLFLTRAGVDIPANPALWRGLRISAGQDGSGTASVFDDFLHAVGLTPADNTRLMLSYPDAIAALQGGQIDLAVFIAPIDAPYLVAAYDAPDLRLVPVAYAQAIARRLSYADTVTLPAGGLLLDPVRPAQPLQLIATEARLAVSGDLHPALINRLSMAAIELHRARDMLSDPEQFPAPDAGTLDMNTAARQLIANGPSIWFDWLPYWMAAQINRVFLLLLPIVFILVPLLRGIPRLFALAMRWRVWQHYPEIRQIEEALAQSPDATTLDALQSRLDRLETRLTNLRLPPAFRQGQYDARLHIGLVQARLDAARANTAV